MKTDVAIIGGGPGGAAAAMFLSQTGLRVTLIEKAQSPRYHIGESLTGECGNCLRALGLEEEMTARRHPVKYGVTVYGPRGKNAFWVPVKGWQPESGLFDTHTWSVRRSDFDHMLFTEAAARGISVMQAEAVAPLLDGDAVHGVRVRTNGGTVEDIASEVLVDASGQATFLANTGMIGEKVHGNYNRQVAVFSQVAGAIRDPGTASGNTLIFYREKHHWAWSIPLDDQVVSVGVVVPADYYRAKNESKHQFLLRELHQLNPELMRRLPEIEFVEEVRGISNYSYRFLNFTGKGFLCVGDSHRFIDPVFSFGVFFAMKEAEYAASSIVSFFADSKREQPNPFADYERLCDRGQDNIQELIDAFWEHPYAFSMLAHHRYPEDIIHMFAGRVYNETPLPGLVAMRAINERGRNKRVAHECA
jgi:1H-pyrrole-2-carbonyl-[peptidyl-carrier protein] brominase